MQEELSERSVVSTQKRLEQKAEISLKQLFDFILLTPTLKLGLFTSKAEPFDGLFGVFADSMPDGWGKLLNSSSAPRTTWYRAPDLEGNIQGKGLLIHLI